MAVEMESNQGYLSHTPWTFYIKPFCKGSVMIFLHQNLQDDGKRHKHQNEMTDISF